MLNLLLRQHVSAFALGHHQVSTCIRRRTIQRVVYIATIIYVDNTMYSSPSDTRRVLMMAQCKGRNMLPQQQI